MFFYFEKRIYISEGINYLYFQEAENIQPIKIKETSFCSQISKI